MTAGIAYQRVLDKFRDQGLKVMETGRDTASAQAPGHSAKDLSVSLKAVDGKALVYSHSDPTDVVMAALGLKMADLWDTPRDREYHYDSGRTVIRQYTADGKKDFRQQHTDRPVELFKLAKVRQASAAGSDIYICEGEEDVRALEALGVTATTNPMGAKNWDKVDYSPVLGAGNVYVVADRDEAGAARARDLAEHLRQMGVRYAGTLLSRTGNDAADHVASGHGLDAFVNSATIEHEQNVERELARLRAQQDARKRLADEAAPPTIPPPLRRLDEFLAEPDEDAEYRVEGLMPTGGNVIVAAQFKAGKSTLIGNLLGSLADGGDFLGQFPANAAGRVVLIDDELDPRTMRRWLRDHTIDHPERVELVSLRGHLSTFNILDPATRAAWADVIGACDVLILDCLRPVLDALGLDENKDAGRFLVAFDALKAEAQIDEAVVVHHMGHSGERSRGDSRILDWPDVSWRIVRENDEPSSPRYFSAFGRDVEVKEGRLSYDHPTRALTYGEGSRKEARDFEAVDEAKAAVLTFVTANPGSSGEQIQAGVPGGKQVTRVARDALVAEGRVEKRNRAGKGGGFAYFPSTPPTPPQPSQGEVLTPPTPVYKTGLGLEVVESEPRQDKTDPGYCTHGTTLGARCTKCGGRAATS
ncbi:AAA family ATPase [Microbacterium sp. A1-JK]|uniref:AAA family ATPase n=1 Tax=Microbacterium sp. A1-JK TaxID=3177516 RepID=UPI0038838B2E